MVLKHKIGRKARKLLVCLAIIIVAYTLFARIKLHRLLLATKSARLMLKYVFNLWIKSRPHNGQKVRYMIWMFLKGFWLSCGALLWLRLRKIWGDSWVASWSDIPTFHSSISDWEKTRLTCGGVVFLNIAIELGCDLKLVYYRCVPVLSKSKFLCIGYQLHLLQVFRLCLIVFCCCVF